MSVFDSVPMTPVVLPADQPFDEPQLPMGSSVSACVTVEGVHADTNAMTPPPECPIGNFAVDYNSNVRPEQIDGSAPTHPTVLTRWMPRHRRSRRRRTPGSGAYRTRSAAYPNRTGIMPDRRVLYRRLDRVTE